MSDFIVDKKGKDFWGPPIWRTLDILTATFRPQNAEHMKNFLWSLSYLLPCEECGAHLREILTRIPIDAYLTNNHDAFFYNYLVHDTANKRISQKDALQQPKVSPNFNDYKAFIFESLSQECKGCGRSV
jgi:hypothetical protein